MEVFFVQTVDIQESFQDNIFQQDPNRYYVALVEEYCSVLICTNTTGHTEGTRVQ